MLPEEWRIPIGLPQAGAGKGGKVQKRYSLPSPEAAAVAGRGGAGQ